MSFVKGRRWVALLGLASTLAFASSSGAQQQSGAASPTPNHDPNAALLVTSDIANFWRAFDVAQRAADSVGRVAAYRDLYIRRGSPGLRDWTDSRLTSHGYADTLLVKRGGWTVERIRAARAAPDGSAERAAYERAQWPTVEEVGAIILDLTIQKRPRFYSAIRGNTLALDTARAFKDSIRARYRRLAELYPEAIFPPVYFEIGRLNSGGTTGTSGMLIGAEMHGADASTPRDELSPWERSVVGDAASLPRLVTHELAHIEQESAGTSNEVRGLTLLALALHEGCADFVADLVSGVQSRDGYNAYGLAHEHELWLEFRSQMRDTVLSNWFYQGDAAKGRPADLGYFVGARICRSYYEHAADKHAALRVIFAMRDPEGFEKVSSYDP